MSTSTINHDVHIFTSTINLIDKEKIKSYNNKKIKNKNPATGENDSETS